VNSIKKKIELIQYQKHKMNLKLFLLYNYKLFYNIFIFIYLNKIHFSSKIFDYNFFFFK
jgi:hypothetical protein